MSYMYLYLHSICIYCMHIYIYIYIHICVYTHLHAPPRSRNKPGDYLRRMARKTEACGVLPSGAWGTFVASRGRLSGADFVWNWNCKFWGGILRGGGGAGWWLLVDCWGLWFWQQEAADFSGDSWKNPHRVSRISMRNGSHFDHPVGANLPNWWYLKLRWYPCSSGNDTLRVSGRKIPQLFTSSPGRLWDINSWELWDKLVMKPEVWSINSKELLIFQGLNRLIFTPQLVLQAIKDLLPERNVSAGRNSWQRPKVGDIEAEDVSRNAAMWGMVVSFWHVAKHVGGNHIIWV